MLILYFSWDGLRGKRLGFWVYLEVKTVGTAVPATAATDEVQAAAKSVDMTDEEKNTAIQAVADALAETEGIGDKYTHFYSDASTLVQVIVDNWNNTVGKALNDLDIEKVSDVTFNIDNASSQTLVDYLNNSYTCKIPGYYIITFADGTTSERIALDLTISWADEGQIQRLMQSASDALSDDDRAFTPATEATADVNKAAEEKLASLTQKLVSELPSDLQTIIADHFELVPGEITTSNNTTYWGAVNILNKETSATATIGIRMDRKQSGEAAKILEELEPDAVTIATSNGKVTSGALTSQEFTEYFGSGNENKLVVAITDANSRISSAQITDIGSITGGSGEQSWVGEVTITLKQGGGTATGKVTIPLNVVSKTAVKDLTLTDNRIDTITNVEKDGNYKLDGVVLKVTYGDDTTKTYIGEDIRNASDLSIDDANWDSGKIGTQVITIRVEGDNDNIVTLPYNVYKNITVTDADMDWSGVSINSVVSEDERILSTNKEGATVRALDAGTTYATVTGTDAKGNSISVRVKVEVAANGDVEYTKELSSATADRQFGQNFAAYAEGQDVVVSVRDSEIANAVYKTDKLGNSHVQVTGNAAGSTKLYIRFGANKKLTYTADITVAKDGTISIGNTDTLNVSSISIPTATEEALESGDYYAASTGAVANYGETATKVVNDAIDEENLWLNVTVGAVTDQIPLKTCEYAFNYPQYGQDKSKIAIRWATGEVVTSGTVSLKEKKDYTNIDLGVAVASYEITDGAGYVKVVETTDENGNKVYSVRPDKLSDASVDFTVNFRDSNGALAKVTGKVNGYQFDNVIATPFEIKENAEKKFSAPSKTVYTIGETFDVSGASFSYLPDAGGDWIDVTVTPDMFVKANSSNEAVSFDTAAEDISVVFKYGNYTSAPFTIKINAAEQKFSSAELGVPAGEGIASIRVKETGSGIAVAESSETFAYITATTVEKSSAVEIQTTEGNTVNVFVTVDKNGKISVEGEVQFHSHAVTVSKDDMNLTATKVSTSDDSVVYAEVQSGKVVITSLTPGTATVTASDQDGHEATIDVTVADDGSITTTVHAYNADGWVDLGNGDWGYIRDGKRVTSDWVDVTEEDPYNNNEIGKVWYHFGSDGLMQRGWIVDETGWKIYLLDSNGRMMHSQWVNAPEQESLNRPAGMYKLTGDGAVQMNGWATSVDNENIEWFCNAGNGLFEVDNPASWRVVG